MNMDTAAGLKVVIGLPSSDTTVTEKTEEKQRPSLSLAELIKIQINELMKHFLKEGERKTNANLGICFQQKT